MRHMRTGLMAAGFATLLAACGGGGGASNVAPIAAAGTARTVEVGTAVFLNGLASSDADGSIASWSWTQTAGPAVTLNSATTAQPNFLAPQSTSPVAFTFRLIVTDNQGATSSASSVTITVNANAAPVANAGAAATVASGAAVSLNGSASSDTDGSIASYAWTQTAGPGVTLSSAAVAQPGFQAPIAPTASTLTFQLIVTDNRGVASAAALVTISVNANVAPVANAGTSRSVAAGANVVLSAAGSSDVDGTIASWSWAQTAGPAVTLNNPTSMTAGFVAPSGSTASTLTFSLIVTDNGGAPSASSTVTITVNANVAPIANAGSFQGAAAGAAVTLNGSASSDPDGTISAYSWTQTAGPAVTLNNAGTATPGFTAPVALTDSTLTFQLIVTDNAGVPSTPATVSVLVTRNFQPSANAGPAQTVAVGAMVTLNGTASTDFGGGSIASYAWTQTSGPAVVLNGAASAQPTFTAPGTPATLTFSLVVTDNQGATSVASSVTITVSLNVTLSGTVRFQRVPFLSVFPFGLDYANPVWRPARAVTVNATLTTGEVVATAVTDASGNYSLTLPGSMTVNVRAVAEMVRGSAQPLPRWNMRVKDGLSPITYAYYTGTVNSSVGTYNLDIPSGISATGVRTVDRSMSSGPFAILDTIYTGMQTVLGVVPTANFPEMYADWGGQTQGVFFTTQNGQHIALLSDVSQDADEYDQHLIAHEFGHYIEENFARSDSIGGPHALGEELDMRVAWGEGFASAFAAIVLNDPLVRDSFVFNGTQVASGFNVETNPAPGDGCWCSETTVWSIVWDLYDNVPDGNDNISLPFSAIWDVLTGPQRLTPSVTSIFSFTEALKTFQPAFAGLINDVVSAQNINSAGIDAFATNETFLPNPAFMTLPLIPTITRGGPPVAVKNFGSISSRYNKVGNRSLLRFTAATSGQITVTLATSNIASDRDPDFLVWNNGVIHWGGVNSSAEYPETETFSVTAGQTYVIDAYDCANGCSTDQGSPGSYTLTVTIN